MSEVKHTPGPWKVDQYLGSRDWIICKDAGNRGQGIDIARTVAATGKEKANAQHIVKCVNNHDRLVEALREVTGELHDEINAKYSEQDLQYPRMQRAMSRDMDSIVKARALLAELEGSYDGA